MDFADTLEDLNITIGDSQDVTFTPEEKLRALQRAWNDSYVVKTVWDDSTIFDSTVFDYQIPSGITTVKDIYIVRGGVQFPDSIESDLYEVVDGFIQFTSGILRYVANGDVIYIKGNYKLDYNSDTLDTTNLQEYVIATAGFNTITLLKYKKANLFVKNDISVAELTQIGMDLDQQRTKLRAMLNREFQGA